MTDEEPSPTVALDDYGNPITENDLLLESYRPPLGNTVSLVPPLDFDGDDDDWEAHQLIEGVRARRRVTKKGG